MVTISSAINNQIMIKNDRATDIIREHADTLLAQEGVTGIAESVRQGEPCLLIYISEDSDRLRRTLPRSLGGMPVYSEVQPTIVADD